MGQGASASHVANIFRITVLSVVILVLVVVLVLIVGWWRGKRTEKSSLGDVNWDKERELLAAIAAQKKAQREAEKPPAKNPPSMKPIDDNYEIPDPLEGWVDEEAPGDDKNAMSGGKLND